MKEVKLACQAMATRFEVVLCGDEPHRLRAAGEEAIQEILRLHADLNAFRDRSTVGRINLEAGSRPVRVSAEIFELLVRVRHLSKITDWAFDPTVGRLLELWGFRGGARADRLPSAVEVAEAKEKAGLHLLILDEEAKTVRFLTEGVRLDLGAIGKGYAIDVAAERLKAAAVESALIHGGTSTARAIGLDPNGNPWKIAIRKPHSARDDAPLKIVSLDDEALSVSTGTGRTVRHGEDVLGHVIDPRTGKPVSATGLTMVVTRQATDADALSTGLLVLGADGIRSMGDQVPGFRGAVFSLHP